MMQGIRNTSMSDKLIVPRVGSHKLTYVYCRHGMEVVG